MENITKLSLQEEDDAMMESLPLPVTEAQTTETETTVTTSTSPAESTVQTLSQGQSSEQGKGALSEDIVNQLGKVSLSKQKLTAKERRVKIKQACEAKGIKYDPNFKRKQKLEKKKAKNPTSKPGTSTGQKPKKAQAIYPAKYPDVKLTKDQGNLVKDSLIDLIFKMEEEEKTSLFTSHYFEAYVVACKDELMKLWLREQVPKLHP
ncbi:hypothetical protein FQR65_LT10085 [Abscondita terminalis]|nr:hypothetical protein FQR65_LT10085 [Abscondita terminalis]